MAAPKIVKLDLRPLQKVVRRFKGDIPRDLKTQWAGLYSTFAKRRFKKFSRGGGDWAPLRPSTIAGRRKGKGTGRVASILWDKYGSLYKALTLGAPGNLKKDIRGGVRFGYGGGAKHKDGGTIAGIAHGHQFGNRKRNLPARPIIVDPDQPTVNRLAAATLKWIDKYGTRVGGPAR